MSASTLMKAFAVTLIKRTISHVTERNCRVPTKVLKGFQQNLARNYAKEGHVCDGCRRALADIPDAGDPECPRPCADRRKKREGILYNIKYKIVEGGTNFGTPFRRLRKLKKKKEPEETEPCEPVETEAVIPQKIIPIPDLTPGVQVAVLGADTPLGQYISLMLKQCPQIKKLRLFQAREQDCMFPPGNIAHPCRNLENVVEDLKHIDTSCRVRAFSSSRVGDLHMCLQNSDIVLMLESGYSSIDMPFEKRFECQAPMVKYYSEAISRECPKAMILVCVSPVDCMVPLVAETMKETDWYDPRKLIGSMAVPEMRASTLAARALCLDPNCTRVPCVGGTEGEALVPLFSKAVAYFDFDRHNAELMSETVRVASRSMARCENCCVKCSELSEAHALARLVKTVAHALLCQDIPKITGFVEPDPNAVISPARFIGNTVELDGSGIVRNMGLPPLSENEMRQVHLALKELDYKLMLVHDWYCKYRCSLPTHDGCKTCDWFSPGPGCTFNDCAYAAVM